jgi:hypothetical protein
MGATRFSLGDGHREDRAWRRLLWQNADGAAKGTQTWTAGRQVRQSSQPSGPKGGQRARIPHDRQTEVPLGGCADGLRFPRRTPPPAAAMRRGHRGKTRNQQFSHRDGGRSSATAARRSTLRTVHTQTPLPEATEATARRGAAAGSSRIRPADLSPARETIPNPACGRTAAGTLSGAGRFSAIARRDAASTPCAGAGSTGARLPMGSEQRMKRETAAPLGVVIGAESPPGCGAGARSSTRTGSIPLHGSIHSGREPAHGVRASAPRSVFSGSAARRVSRETGTERDSIRRAKASLSSRE